MTEITLAAYETLRLAVIRAVDRARDASTFIPMPVSEYGFTYVYFEVYEPAAADFFFSDPYEMVSRIDQRAKDINKDKLPLKAMEKRMKVWRRDLRKMLARIGEIEATRERYLPSVSWWAE